MTEKKEHTIGCLIDDLTDTRYLFEVFGKALQAYEDKGNLSEMYYLNGAFKMGMERLRVIEDSLCESKP